MNTLSRTITGIVMMIGGLFLILLPLFISNKETLWAWIYGIPIFILGLFILFNKKEDKIEEIKKARRNK